MSLLASFVPNHIGVSYPRLDAMKTLLIFLTLIIASTAGFGAVLLYRHAIEDPQPDDPSPESTVTATLSLNPTPEEVTRVPTRASTDVPTSTPTTLTGGPIPPQIPFPSPIARNTSNPGELSKAPLAHSLRLLTGGAWLRLQDPRLYHSIAELTWVSDGISPFESDPVEALIALSSVDPEATRTLLKMTWLTDGIDEEEAWVVGALAFIAFQAPNAVSRLVSLPWLIDGINENESWAVSSLADLSSESTTSVMQLLSKAWYTDGISEDESLAVTMIGSISHDTGSASKFVQMPFLDSIEPADHFALGSLATLGYESPEVFDSILSHPSVADGITNDEATVVALVYDVQATNPDLIDTLLDPSATQIEKRDIILPLAGNVQLSIVRMEPGAARSMDLLENAVRFAEDYMNEPLPLNFVLLLYADAVQPGYAGHNTSTNMTVHPDFDSDADESDYAASILAHEVAHYYWGNSAEMWLDEGAAELMAIIHEEATIGRQVWDSADAFPCPYAADLSALERLSDDASTEDCAYNLGTRFFLDLHRALGEDEFRRGFRMLYLLGRDALDPDDPGVRRIDHVRDAFDFSTVARDEVIPRWYWE